MQPAMQPTVVRMKTLKHDQPLMFSHMSIDTMLLHLKANKVGKKKIAYTKQKIPNPLQPGVGHRLKNAKLTALNGSIFIETDTHASPPTPSTHVKLVKIDVSKFK
jgi:hypothetical protein